MSKQRMIMATTMDLVFVLRLAYAAEASSLMQKEENALKIKKRSSIGKNIQESSAFG